jgi:hypothetical protein
MTGAGGLAHLYSIAPKLTMSHNVLTLLVKSRQSISNAMEVSLTRGMCPVSLALKHRVQGRPSVLF